MTELIHEDETYRIRGAVFEVYREMGCGFLEAVYQECLTLEFARQGVPFVAQKALALHYKGEKLSQTFIPDFVCFESIVVEIKAVNKLTNDQRAQVHNYLKSTGLQLGLLVNFGHYPKAEVERVVRT